jgi:hypothetical protein
MEIEPGGMQQQRRPAALTDVEPERAGGVRHVLDHLAGQAVADIGLRQQHLCDALEDLGSWRPPRAALAR